jgi:hypothetical protein
MEDTGRTFFIDVDGTIVKHLSNGEIDAIVEKLKSGELSADYCEPLLDGVRDFWKTFAPDDRIIITTARTESHRALTERIFKKNGLKFHLLVMDLTSGSRYLINDVVSPADTKAIAINVIRDVGIKQTYNLQHYTQSTHW